MKVVIFCGGMGVRMGEATQTIPKPMINVGPRPILWHIMKWYASWGHTEFVLCLGYRAEMRQGVLPDIQRGARKRLRARERRAGACELLGRDMEDWQITFVDTGLHSVVGERLKAVERHVARRADVPRDVRRRPDGCSARRHGRELRAERQDGPVHLGASRVRVPRRPRRRGSASSARSTTSPRPMSGSTAASSSSGRTSSTRSGRARISSTSPSRG